MNLSHWFFNVLRVKLLLNKLEDLNFLRKWRGSASASNITHYIQVLVVFGYLIDSIGKVHRIGKKYKKVLINVLLRTHYSFHYLRKQRTLMRVFQTISIENP